MANNNMQHDDVLDKAMRIDDVGNDPLMEGVVRKAPGRITADDLDENRSMEDEVESGLRIADDEFENISVGGLLGDDIDPDLVQFDEDGNIVKKNPKKKKQDPNDPFADDEDEVDEEEI